MLVKLLRTSREDLFAMFRRIQRTRSQRPGSAASLLTLAQRFEPARRRTVRTQESSRGARFAGLVHLLADYLQGVALFAPFLYNARGCGCESEAERGFVGNVLEVLCSVQAQQDRGQAL